MDWFRLPILCPGTNFIHIYTHVRRVSYVVRFCLVIAAKTTACTLEDLCN